MTTEARPFARAAPWLWAVLSMACWFASLLLALPIASLMPEVGGLRSDLGLVLAINGVASIVAVHLLGRVLLHRSLVRPGSKLLLPLAGIALAIAVELALHEWAEARFGYYEAELIRWTAGLSPTLVLLAVASFGVLVAPRKAVVSPLVALILAVAGIIFIVGSNVPGLNDGIDADGWPLAALVGVSALYAVGTLAVAVRTALAD